MFIWFPRCPKSPYKPPSDRPHAAKGEAWSLQLESLTTWDNIGGRALGLGFKVLGICRGSCGDPPLHFPIQNSCQGVFLWTLRVCTLGFWVPKPWNMALNKGIWGPKLRGTNIKGTNLKSLIISNPQTLDPKALVTPSGPG